MFVLLVHGSNNGVYQQQLSMLADDVSAILAEKVAVATLASNNLPEGADVLPLFLGQGKHIQEDVPRLIADAKATMLPPLYEHSDALAQLVLSELTQKSKRIHLLFSVYQFTGFGRVVASLYKHGKGCTMAAMSALHGSPNIQSVLNNIAQQGIKKVVLQPMFLFEGYSLAECKKAVQGSSVNVEIQPALVETTGFAALIANILKQSKS